MAAKPTFHGKLYANIGETLHKRLFRAAEKAGMTMTKYTTKLIREGLAQKAQKE